MSTKASDVQTMLSHPLRSSQIVKQIQFNRLLEQLRITWIWTWVLENNPGGRNPYHSNAHMQYVALSSAQLYMMECIPDGGYDETSLAELVVAALLHDYGHTAGEASDEKNIEIALETGLGEMYETLENQFGRGFVDRVVGHIRCTQYPFVYEPNGLIQQCIRDADAMQSFEPDGVSIIMEGLRAEMQVSMAKPITRREMAEGQIKFLEGIVYFTNSAKQLHEALLPCLREVFLAYAEIVEPNLGTDAKAAE